MVSPTAAYVSTMRRALTTPEGIDLAIEIASFGARIAAFIVDIFLLYGSIILLTIAGLLMVSGHIGIEPSMFLGAVWLVIVFVFRNFWFILFEMSARGATPGKRLLGLRVVARDGGRLEASGVVARNLMREIEVMLPLAFIGSIGSAYAMLGFGWTLIFLLFPLFNKDRMRAGDLLGGTWVIRAPRVKIRSDLRDDALGLGAFYTFTAAQIAVYGAFELQTLERLLRGKDSKDSKEIATVADVIRAKIGWPHGDDDDRAFLQAYYSAVRGALEKDMLFGKRRRDKHDTG